MKYHVLDSLCCPSCRNDLSVQSVARRTEEHIVDGVLICTGCKTAFPVLDKIPRLVDSRLLSKGERASLQELCRRRSHSTDILSENPMSSEEQHDCIEEIVRTKIRTDHLKNEKLRTRLEHDIQYRICHTEKKEKFVRTLDPFLPSPPRRIVEIGGGQGGLISCFRRQYHPEVALLVDLDLTWAEVALLRDPETEVIRADATRLPIKDKAFDVMISTSTLEHVAAWRSVVGEMVRISDKGFLSYSPNGFFPYDWGHVDAPLVPFLPKTCGAVLAKAWHILRRSGRSYASIREELATTVYIPRPAVVRELENNGVKVTNVFVEFLNHSVESDYHYSAKGLKIFLRRHKGLLRILAQSLICVAMEPMVDIVYES